MSRFFFVTPSYLPVGGVVKVFDYVNHALAGEFDEVEVICRFDLRENEALFDLERFRTLLDDPRVTFTKSFSRPVEDRDFVLFSWPTDYHAIEEALASATPTNRVIHLIQNVRHANPVFAEGYGVRILGRPMSRISITHQVTEACQPFLNPNGPFATVVEGHAWEFFSLDRPPGLPNPIKIGYTTWKSAVGARVEELLADDPRFEFSSIRRTVAWDELRTLYHWSDVFLGCPGPEEGFYLPGVEAFAAGCVFLVPDVGGNLAYSRFEDNCLEVSLDDADSYVRQLTRLAEASGSFIDDLRSAAYATLGAHTLEAERSGFEDFLTDINQDRRSHQG